jgi:hypothetical protein
MNMRINVVDTLSPDLRRSAYMMQNPRPLMAAMGKALEIELRTIFREFDTTRPNKQGWPRSHFWNRRVAQKTALTNIEARSATVTIASPELLHKIKGGVVRPKRGKTLAIPANGLAYKLGGPRASGRDYQFLLLAQGNLVGALINLQSTSISIGKKGVKAGKERGGDVMYWLVRSVTHKPNPAVDPANNPALRSRIENALSRTASAVIPRLLRR